jgi:hypothetical protein
VQHTELWGLSKPECVGFHARAAGLTDGATTSAAPRAGVGAQDCGSAHGGLRERTWSADGVQMERTWSAHGAHRAACVRPAYPRRHLHDSSGSAHQCPAPSAGAAVRHDVATICILTTSACTARCGLQRSSLCTADSTPSASRMSAYTRSLGAHACAGSKGLMHA